MIDITELATDQTSDQKKNLYLVQLFPLLGILGLIMLIYSPVLVNAFNGDDFVHLQWLAEAVKQPELVWRNFHSAWLDITTAKFYRPLISLFMLWDYVVWHGNGIGFHLTNLLCHLANTYLLWLVLRQMPLDSDNPKWNYMWCLSAATLFGLYPLHPEAVSWITGRVDTFVTLFCLASLYAYMRWRQSGIGEIRIEIKTDIYSDTSSDTSSHTSSDTRTDAKTDTKTYIKRDEKWFLLSWISMALALMCKEMAITLPAIFCAYEFFIAAGSLPVRERLLCVLKSTFMFWLLLAFYFVVRYFSLGTLIGGYDNTLLSLDTLRGLISAWRRSLYVFLFPLNENLVSKPFLIKFIWGGLLSVNFILVAKDIFSRCKNNATIFFLLSWLVLSLVPLYKLFNISPDLQGSRLAYLPSVPLCALLCFGYATHLEIKSKIRYWALLALVFLLSSAGALLLVNNSAWIKAEGESKAIVSQLNDLSKTINDKSAVYIVGLPDEINGAYVCRNALSGMSRRPQISKNIDACFNLDEINHVFPFGYARRSMRNTGDYKTPPAFYVWNEREQKLKNFSLPDKVISLPFTVYANNNALKPTEGEITIDLKDMPCFDLECLVVRVDFQPVDEKLKRDKKHDSKVCSLFYTNDIVSQFDDAHRLDVMPEPGAGEQRLVFSLHGQPDWAMGNKAHLLKLVLPKSRACSIKNMSFEPIEKIMPNLYFKANGNQNDLGFIELKEPDSSCQLYYDASKVLGASEVMCEISAPDQVFAVVNNTGVSKSFYSGSVFSSSSFSSKKLKGLAGLISLSRRDFALPGMYELRLRAFDSNNKQIGIAGDHIVITVK